MARVALVQVAVNSAEAVGDRVERVEALTSQAIQDADIAILPELWPTGAFDLDQGLANAQPLDGPLVERLAGIARASGKWLHGGSFVEVDDGQHFNTSVVFGPDGSLAATYRKVHLFGFDTGEAAQLTAGRELVVLETPLGTTGLATCYDLRFPELFRQLMLRGATTVLMASGWPARRLPAWQILSAARAVENQQWFIGCNSAGTHADVELAGHSVVFDPLGVKVAELDNRESVRFVTIAPESPSRIRQDFPVLRDRQPWLP